MRSVRAPAFRYLFRSAAAAFLLAAASPASALVVGVADSTTSGNAFPFGSNSGDRYQQVYAAGNFSGAVVITGLNFFAAQSSIDLNRQYTGATYTVGLSTTPLGVNTINESFNLDSNLGADNQLLTVSTLSGAIDPVLSFLGTAFAYDPSLGDLLIDINVTAGGGPTGALFQEDQNNGGIMSRAQNFGGGFDNRGLVTEFVFGEVTLPAPGGAVFLALAAFALAARRR
jgi:hypothetical protein